MNKKSAVGIHLEKRRLQTADCRLKTLFKLLQDIHKDHEVFL